MPPCKVAFQRIHSVSRVNVSSKVTFEIFKTFQSKLHFQFGGSKKSSLGRNVEYQSLKMSHEMQIVDSESEHSA